MKQLQLQIWISSCLMALLTSVNCELTRAPSDVYGVTGSTVTLHCSTNLSVPVQWEFKRVGAVPIVEPWTLVYFGYPTSQITARYRDKNKYSVIVDSTGNEYNLMIYNLQTDDAGTYRCIDDYGFGGHKHDEGISAHQYEAQVVAIDGALICSESINGYLADQRSLKLEQNDTIQLKCLMTCVGNTFPRISWSVFHIGHNTEYMLFLPDLNVTESERKSGNSKTFISEVEMSASEMTKDLYVRCKVCESANGNISVHGIASPSPNQLQVIWSISVTETNVKIIAPLDRGSGKFVASSESWSRISMAVTVLIPAFLIGALTGICAVAVIMLKKCGYWIAYRDLIKLHKEIQQLRNAESKSADCCELQRLISVRAEDDNLHSRSTPTKAIRLGKEVRGITVVHDKVYAVHVGTNEMKVNVYIYDLQTFQSQSQINLPNLKRPLGLAGSSHSKALYVTADEKNYIHRVNLSNKSVNSWEVGYTFPRGLSMTSKNNLLVTIRGESTRILEYSDEGRLIRDIQLDESVDQSWQAIQLSDDNFIISHGLPQSPFHRLLSINSEGMITKIHGREYGEDQDQLCEPAAIAVDFERNLLFVADFGNQRVLEFTTDLKLIGQVQTPNPRMKVTRLYFHSSSDQLFLGDNNGLLLIINSSDIIVSKIQGTY